VRQPMSPCEVVQLSEAREVVHPGHGLREQAPARRAGALRAGGLPSYLVARGA